MTGIKTQHRQALALLDHGEAICKPWSLTRRYNPQRAHPNRPLVQALELGCRLKVHQSVVAEIEATELPAHLAQEPVGSIVQIMRQAGTAGPFLMRW